MSEYTHVLELDGEEVTLTWVGRSRSAPSRVHALAFTHTGEILLVSDGPSHPERWLPGGGVEEGETPEEALQRELIEEADAAIEASAYLGSQRLDGSGEEQEFLRYYWCRVALARQEQPRGEPTVRHLVSPDEFLEALQWGSSDPAAPLLLELAIRAELQYKEISRIDG